MLYFADDIKISRTIRSSADCILLQIALDFIMNWFIEWQL